MSKSSNWITITESKYPWEREALQFIRAQFPAREPFQAWSNFEFIADDGSINEVDLLLFTPHGLFLVEIKSNPGRLIGDAGTWTWLHEGRQKTVDNPLLATNLKSKKLRSLLERQKVCQKKGSIPFIEPLIFCSAEGLQCELQTNARTRVCLRDRSADGDSSARNGILAAILRREAPGLESIAKGVHDKPTAKRLAQALEQAGIRPSQHRRRVADYELEQLIGEGPGYQDWQAHHTQLNESHRRVRLYLVRAGATPEDRKIIERAALREFQILEALQHPGVLRVYGYTEHELGPALIFEQDPRSLRLDHFLAQRQQTLSTDARLDLMRQIAEAVRFAHEKKVVHRSLSPQSILVTEPDSPHPRIKIFNWQVGYRRAGSTSSSAKGVSATAHVDRLVDDGSTAYMAPEAFFDEDNTGEHLDVFSLGALAYHIFSGITPAANGLELSNRLRETKGLQISSVLNGAGEHLQFLVQLSTHPEVSSRLDSVTDFLEALDEVEEELTAPEYEYIEDPDRAQPGDTLPGNLRVIKRLGQGACSIALLVERDGQAFVLKVANQSDNNGRVREESELLSKHEMRHVSIVDWVATVEVGDRVGFLMRPVFADREKQLIETLGHRLRKEGRLHIDLLQRFGEDLLSVVNHLEEQGIPHRDIKPDNIAVGKVGRGDKLHLVLFDFSLSRVHADNIRAGTTGYLDPLLSLRKPPRWDLHAERYAAAVTLFELATGNLPRWGDGTSDPSHLTCEATVDGELFDAALRERLVPFFTRAFRRDLHERFPNAEEMLRTWRHCFADIDAPGNLTEELSESELRALLANATYDTPIHELGLGTRATNALDRADILSVEDLLTVPRRRLLRLRGVGNKTRREINAALRILRERFETSVERTLADTSTEPTSQSEDLGQLSVDLLVARLLKRSTRSTESTQRVATALLGLDLQLSGPWPSQAEVAELVKLTRARVGQVLGTLETRWSKDRAITQLRSHLVEIVEAQGGVMSATELADALIVARGCVETEPRRSQLACAAVRAAIEVERAAEQPRLIVRRNQSTVLIASNAELAAYAGKLGELADQMADEDPLVPPARVLERLRAMPAPDGVALADSRLLRLAVSASRHADVSSKQEIYARGMPVARALKLAHGAIAGASQLTIAELHERLRSRYPEAAPLPDRPALDRLLAEAGFEFEWDPHGKRGQGAFTSRHTSQFSVTSGSSLLRRFPTTSGRPEPGELTPEVADARQFEERLARSARDGAFLTLLVAPKHYQLAARELGRRFSIDLLDFEGLFLDSLQQEVAKAGVDWNLVLATDATPGSGDWDKLQLLVGRVLQTIEQRFSRSDRTQLVIYAGVLARYDRMDVLEHLRERVGRRGGLHGLWLLIPGDQEALLDGKAVPLLGPGQRIRIPESWLSNLHRAVQH